MSFIDPNAFYQEEILLLDQKLEAPTPITQGQVMNGNLQPWRGRLEINHTGNELQSSAILTLRIPPDGTFVRKEPILIDESAKDDYIIQIKLKQDRDKDGIYEEEGKLFRFFIGQPTLADDASTGETLKITLIAVEYHTRETLDSERLSLPFLTPKDAFIRRLFAYNTIKGADNTQLIPSTIALPDAESLRQEWRPLAPTATHDLFRIITKSLSLPSVTGGVFRDFFFDYEAHSLSTKIVTIKAEEEGTIDRGVVLDPLLFQFVSGTEKDKEINVDLIKFKNHVVMEGNPVGGTLPTECSKFASLYDHQLLRPEWDETIQYFDGTLGTDQSEIRIFDPFLSADGFNTGTGQTRFFKAINTTGNININPTTNVLKEAYWEEDFVTIPDYNKYASYNKGDIVVKPNSDPQPVDIFYRALSPFGQGVPNNPDPSNPIAGATPQPGGTLYWQNTGQSFLRGLDHPLINPNVLTGNLRAGRTHFFSYTPWTSDFEAMRAGTLFGINDNTQLQNFEEIGYQGVVPDWNFVRANFDRVEADNQYEQVVGKDIIKTITAQPPAKESYTGARYLVSTTPSGVFVGHANQIAEYAGEDFDPTGGAGAVKDWRFSNFPKDGEVICDQSRGVMLVWKNSTTSWENLWNITDVGAGGVTANLFIDIIKGVTTPALGPIFGPFVSILFDPLKFGSATRHSPLHICRDIKLVEGASGIPAQAFELRFDWDIHDETQGESKNYNSIGAWWYMSFPYPKFPTFNRDVGSVYQNPTIDTNNLTKNHKGDLGWNKGIDSEDLGRIQQIHFKARLSLYGSITGKLVIGYADMPMICWAVDIFDRIWFTRFKIARNGQYGRFSLSFGESSAGELHHGQYDEYLTLFGIVLETDWRLKEKEWNGIEFDWRFVKGMGVFYEVGYNNEGLYVANQFPDYAKNISEQVAGQGFPFIASVILPGEGFQPGDLLVNNTRLAIDELHFKKSLYVTSDNKPTDLTGSSRAILDHDASEVDYINLKIKSQSSRERKKFIEQVWYMQSHGDVRLRFGEKLVASGLRVPGGTQNLICSEVKHVIDNDGYMMHIVAKRKFVFEE